MNKLLRKLYQKRTDRGASLVELLVVILLIGIFSSIALSFYLMFLGRAKEAEAVLKIGDLNKSQNVYYIEKGEFTSDFSQLNFASAPQESEDDGLVSLFTNVVDSMDGVEFSLTEEENYIYVILVRNDDEPRAIHIAVSKILFARTYAAALYMKASEIESCIPEQITISLDDPESANLQILKKLMSNPTHYCPG